MKVTTVGVSSLVKHPIMRMDAVYHVGKAEGKTAYIKIAGGLLQEDDEKGTIMLFPKDAEKYNRLKVKLRKFETIITDQLKQIIP